MSSAKKDVSATSKKVKICELDIYPKKDALSDYRFVEEDPVFLQSEMSNVRKVFEPIYKDSSAQYTSIRKFGNCVQTTYFKIKKYVTEENTSALPKSIAITVGGMGGFLLGMKRGGAFKRVFYTGLGLSTVAAFCYPHQTMDLVRTSSEFAQKQWDSFSASPPPPRPMSESPKAKLDSANKGEKSPEKEILSSSADGAKSKDIDMYTTRSDKIS